MNPHNARERLLLALVPLLMVASAAGFGAYLLVTLVVPTVGSLFPAPVAP